VAGVVLLGEIRARRVDWRVDWRVESKEVFEGKQAAGLFSFLRTVSQGTTTTTITSAIEAAGGDVSRGELLLSADGIVNVWCYFSRL